MEVSGQLHVQAALPQGKSPFYPLDRRLSEPQNRSGRGGEEKIPSPRRESKPGTLIVQPVAQRYTDWAITALMLLMIINDTGIEECAETSSLLCHIAVSRSVMTIPKEDSDSIPINFLQVNS
jgi:hypothetical protein